MLKTNLFKRGMSMLTAAALMAGLLVCGTAVREPITVEAAAAAKNIAAPVYSFTLDFEEDGVTKQNYGKSSKIQGNGINFETSAGVEDTSVDVLTDTTGKFNGSTVLRINPLSTSSGSQAIAYLRPSGDDWMDDKYTSAKVFTLKDSDGNRLSHGYRMHYSYDFYVPSITVDSDTTDDIMLQDLMWCTDGTEKASEAILYSKEGTLLSHNSTKATATTPGTLGYHAGTWKQSEHDAVIHMDYVVDFETGEIWEYRNGELYQSRDFSEVPRGYFKNASSNSYYQTLQDNDNMRMRFRINAKDYKEIVYYDNFKVDMYGTNVSAKQLRELVSESTTDHNGSAITASGTAEFTDSATTDDFYIGSSTNSDSTDVEISSVDGRLKIQRASGANADGTLVDNFLNVEPLYNTYASVNPRDEALNLLPDKPVNSITPLASKRIFTKRLGFDRTNTSSTLAYDLYEVDFHDYLKISTDIEIDETTQTDVWMYGNWYPFDGQAHTNDTMPDGMGVKGTYSTHFIRFNMSDKTVSAFGVKNTDVTWQKGQTYHVDYLVNLKTGKEVAILDGVVIGENTTDSITERGSLLRVRANFGKATTADIMYLDNFNYTLYNELNTSFEALENELAYAATIEDLAGQLTDSGVNVTAKIGGNADKYSNAKIITALYQDYGEEDAKLLDAAISDYEGEDDAFAVTLNAGEGTGTLLVKMFIWSMDALTPLCEAEESQAVAATVAAVYPNNTMKALTIGFDDCNDTANNYILSAMADYSQGLKKNCQPPLM